MFERECGHRTFQCRGAEMETMANRRPFGVGEGIGDGWPVLLIAGQSPSSLDPLEDDLLGMLHMPCDFGNGVGARRCSECCGRGIDAKERLGYARPVPSVCRVRTVHLLENALNFRLHGGLLGCGNANFQTEGSALDVTEKSASGCSSHLARRRAWHHVPAG